MQPDNSTTRAAGRILLVDDEPALLNGVQRMLRGKFDLVVADGGAAGLAKLREDPSIVVIVSDMQMPGMDGATFLSEARTVAPQATRVMLTGNADQETAVKAVNNGAIFRFLNKPCETDELVATLHDALELASLRQLEKDMLDRTLKGAIQIMVEIATASAPERWRCSQEASRCAGQVARKLGVAKPWEVEIAALLLVIGASTLPQASAQPLAAAGSANAIPPELARASARLVAHVPRLGAVAELLEALAAEEGSAAARSPGARIIRRTYEVLLAPGAATDLVRVIAEFKNRALVPDKPVLGAIEDVLVGEIRALVECPLELDDLKVGMILCKPVVSSSGALLLPNGHTLTPLLLERIRNHNSVQGVRTPISVLLPKAAAPSASGPIAA